MEAKTKKCKLCDEMRAKYAPLVKACFELFHGAGTARTYDGAMQKLRREYGALKAVMENKT